MLVLWNLHVYLILFVLAYLCSSRKLISSVCTYKSSSTSLDDTIEPTRANGAEGFHTPFIRTLVFPARSSGSLPGPGENQRNRKVWVLAWRKPTAAAPGLTRACVAPCRAARLRERRLTSPLVHQTSRARLVSFRSSSAVSPTDPIRD